MASFLSVCRYSADKVTLRQQFSSLGVVVMFLQLNRVIYPEFWISKQKFYALALSSTLNFWIMMIFSSLCKDCTQDLKWQCHMRFPRVISTLHRDSGELRSTDKEYLGLNLMQRHFYIRLISTTNKLKISREKSHIHQNLWNKLVNAYFPCL